jgi:hypothetical protein
MAQKPTDQQAATVQLALPPEVAAVIMAAAASAIAESDTVPSNVVAVISASIRAMYPTATSITISKSIRQGGKRRLRYRKRPPDTAWTTHGRAAVMASRAPR